MTQAGRRALLQRIFRHAAWSWLALSGAVFAQADLRYPLAAGIYRFEGRCVEFSDSISEHLDFCRNALGIIATKPELPEFYFMTADGKAWVFPTKKLKKATNEGRHTEFSIANFMELGPGTVYKFDGDCTLDFDQRKLRLACHARKGRKVVRTAVFESAGTFAFSREATAPAGGGKQSQ